MIDTIRFRIHNLESYTGIYEQFFRPLRKKNSFTTALVDEQTGELFQSTQLLSAVYHDTDKFLPYIHRSKLNLGSWSYGVNYSISGMGDNKTIDFEFSVPKLLYGQNVMEFVNPYDFDMVCRYSRFNSFLSDFLKQNFIQIPSLVDVEILRIDFCFNQYFNEKKDAIMYLEAMKDKHITKARERNNRPIAYSGTMFYKTDRYSFKVYHKGEEFAKHDFKQLLKHNPKKYELGFFQAQADNILRYELTYRRSGIQYLHHYNCFDRLDTEPYIAGSSSHMFARRMRELGLSKPFNQYKRRTKLFMMKSIYDITKNVTVIYSDTKNTCPFDAVLFEILHDNFWKKVKEWQIQAVSPVSDIVRKIDLINEQMANARKGGIKRGAAAVHERKSMDKNRLLLPAMLAQYMDISDLKKYMPESTYNDLKRDLKIVGIANKVTDIAIPQPPLTHQNYFQTFSKYIQC